MCFVICGFKEELGASASPVGKNKIFLEKKNNC